MVKKLQQDVFDGLLLFQSYSGSRSDLDVLASYHGKARQTATPPSVGPLKTSRSLRSNEIDVCLMLLTLPCPERCAKTYRRQHKLYDYLPIVAIILIRINMEDEAIKARDQLIMSFPVT